MTTNYTFQHWMWETIKIRSLGIVRLPLPPLCDSVGLSLLSWNGANSFPWKPTSYNSVHFGL